MVYINTYMHACIHAYFALVTQIFEYGCIICNQVHRNDIYLNEIEKLRIQGGRIIRATNSYNYASKILLYYETGWNKLSQRRQNIDLHCYISS